MKKEEGYKLIERYINEVSTQLRNTQNVNMSKAKYMELYNKAFENKGKDVLILKEIFDEWIEKYLKVTVAQNLIQAQDFVDSFLFEFSLFKSLLRYFTILFYNYEVYQGSQQVYLVESGLNIFDKLIMLNETIKTRYLESFQLLLNDLRMTANNNTKQKLLHFSEVLDLFCLAQNYRLEIVVIEKEIKVQIREKTIRRQTIESPVSEYISYLFETTSEASRKFYSELSINWLRGGSSMEYIRKATNQVKIEMDIEATFYAKFTKANETKRSELVKIFTFEILEARIDQIISNPNDGFQQQLIQRKNEKDLQIIADVYNLYKLTVINLERVLLEFQNFVQNQVLLVFTEQAENRQPAQQNQPPQNQIAIHIAQIDQLQLVYEYCTSLVVKCFDSSHKFRNNMELSFKEKLNYQDKFIDKLAMYIHISLKDRLKETTNDEDQQKFNKFRQNIMAFIQFVNSKGKLFLKITDNLKERIFKGEIKNFGFEEEFLRSLRREHPEHLPSDLLIVWKDFKFYRNLDSEIQSQLTQRRFLQGTNVQFTVFTRTNSLKEFNNQNRRDQIRVPDNLSSSIEFMEKYYQQKQQTEKKTLVWNFKVGQSRINYKFGPGPQQQGQFFVSNLQLFIILTLKQNNGRNKHELLQDTGIGYEEELTYQLEPLLDKKLVIQKGEQYVLQTDQAQLKVKLIPNKPLPLVPKKQVENQEDLQQLKKEKDIKIQSCIVRLMKTNKEMIYPQLFQGCSKSLLGYYDFSAQDILAQIDELINGNYIRRDDRINNKFIYTPQ